MFGLYPAGSDWTCTFATENLDARDIQKSLVEHAGFAEAIFHQPFGEHRGAVIAQFGKVLVLCTTTPGADTIAVTPTVEMQHLFWAFREGYSTQWSSLEIRTVTGYKGWDELMTGAQREFSRVCDQVAKAITGSLKAPNVVEETVHVPFPNEDDDAFYQQMADLSSEISEVPSCAL